jgi:MoaA/NifB/PqqE/SkfB family radical SAM enzyme
MKDFKHWGAKKRVFPAYNYNALWFNLKTIRLGSGVAKELPADMAEFYDVGINTLCNAECPFCYVSASQKGINYPNICETWEKWMDTYQSKVKNGTVFTNKPFQIAIGSTGEPTIHPDFCKFLETVYNTGVVPNYTTNGITLSSIKTSRELLEYTRNFVGGVAVSLGNKALKRNADMAIVNLITMGDTNVNIHHIISTKDSVDDFIKEWKRYGSDIKYHVLLPLMPSGRSSKGLDEGVFEYLEEKILEENVTNVAFGAHFCKYLKNSKIPTYLYPPESLSKNVILTKDKVQITPSSFNLNPIKIIEL